MNINSKKVSLIILGITATVLSRFMFVFFNDPEGPNLLVVGGMAVMIYFASLGAYLSNLSGSKKLILSILIQIIVVAGLYFCLK